MNRTGWFVTQVSFSERGEFPSWPSGTSDRCTSCRLTTEGHSRRTCSAGRARLSDEQTAKIAAMKQVIYDGFKKALAGGVPRQKAGILVDEQFGADILRDAGKEGYITACPAEKSGQDDFDFEYGEDFGRHIATVPADFLQGARAI